MLCLHHALGERKFGAVHALHTKEMKRQDDTNSVHDAVYSADFVKVHLLWRDVVDGTLRFCKLAEDENTVSFDFVWKGRRENHFPYVCKRAMVGWG